MTDHCLNGCGRIVRKPNNRQQKSYYPFCRKCARKAQIRIARVDSRNRRAQEKDDAAG